MSDTFVPLNALAGAPVRTGAFQLKVMAQAQTKAIFQPLPSTGGDEHSSPSCAAPAVTVQRQGEVISGIRVECGCGQVIELACSY